MNIEPRALSDDEQTTLTRLLSADFEGAQALRVQALSVDAFGKCDCGCPTIDLRVTRPLPKSTASTPIPGRGLDRGRR